MLASHRFPDRFKKRTSGLTRVLLVLGLILALGATNARSQNAPTGKQSPSVENLTQALLALNLRVQTTGSTEKTQLLNELSQLAQTRQEALAALVQNDPAAALRVALPANVRSGLPAEVQNLVEQEVTIEGVLEVSIEDHAKDSRLLHFLNVAGERLSLHFAADPPTHLLTGSVIRAHGVRFGSGLALTSGGTTSTSSVQTVSAALPNTFGAQKTLVILVNFQDNTSQPWTPATAQNAVFTTASNFFLENSFQKTWLTGDVAGWYTLPISSTTCNIASIQTYAQQAAQSAGYVMSNYNRFLYAFPQTSACGWWGWSYIGGSPSNSWINGNLQLQVVGHELGHALGLYHSHGLNCSGAVYATSGCTQYEYGNYYDIMASSTSMHYNAFQKERLGWLNYSGQPPITSVSSSGSYTIAPYETEDANPKGLKILQSSSSGTYYYVEFREPIGFDNTPAFTNSYGYNNVINGIVVHLASPSNANSSDLLNMNPSSSWDYAMALDVGQSYTDSTAGITISTTAVSGTGATVNVTFGAATCVPANPTLSLSPSQSQWVLAGATVSFTVSVANNDNSGCSPSSFNLGATVPSGWISALGSSMLTLSPGGSASTTLQVTSPSGTANGFYNVGVSATNAATSSYTVSASATCVISTPVTLSIAVATNQSSYARGQTVSTTVTLLSGTLPDAGAAVAVNISKSNGSVVTLSGTTGSNGIAVLTYKLKKMDPTGTYKVQASTTASGSTASTVAATTFTVQ